MPVWHKAKEVAHQQSLCAKRKRETKKKRNLLHSSEVSKVFPCATRCVTAINTLRTSILHYLRPCSDTETPLGGDRAPSTGTAKNTRVDVFVFRYDLELPVCVECSAHFTGFSRLVQKRSVGIRSGRGGAKCWKINKSFLEQAGEVFKPALFSGCFF